VSAPPSGRTEDAGNVERARGTEEQEHADEKAEITDAVGDEGLLARAGIGVFFVPKTDEQVAGQAHALPADEHHGQAVAQHQHQHGAAEQVEVGEEARVVLVVGHVAGRVDVDQRADEGDHQAQQARQWRPCAATDRRRRCRRKTSCRPAR
jgi:hypothetical protein